MTVETGCMMIASGYFRQAGFVRRLQIAGKQHQYILVFRLIQNVRDIFAEIIQYARDRQRAVEDVFR